MRCPRLPSRSRSLVRPGADIRRQRSRAPPFTPPCRIRLRPSLPSTTATSAVASESMNRRTLAVVVTALVLTSAGTARAQAAQDKAAAEVLFEEGKELMHQKKFGLACPKFLESNRLDAGLGTILWLADCYEKNGQTASAWGQFREAAEIAARQHDPREKVAHARAVRLERTLAKMTIIVGAGTAVPGLEVTRDGDKIGQPSWGEEVPVDPGPHKIAVTAPHKKPWESIVNVSP